jgi:hypothetical protein
MIRVGKERATSHAWMLSHEARLPTRFIWGFVMFHCFFALGHFNQFGIHLSCILPYEVVEMDGEAIGKRVNPKRGMDAACPIPQLMPPTPHGGCVDDCQAEAAGTIRVGKERAAGHAWMLSHEASLPT